MIGGAGVTAALPVTWHPIASVTITEYVPGQRLLQLAVVHPVFQLIE